MPIWPDIIGTSLTSFKIGINKLVFDASGLTSARSVTVPDKAGTLAYLSDVSTIVVQTAATRNETATSGVVIILCDCTSNNITINLPTAIGNTARYKIKKIDSSSNTVIIDPFGTQTIDGSTTVTISKQYLALELVSDNTNLSII